MADYYPQAKVLHSVRDPDAWFESTQATIFAPDSIPMKMLMSGEGPGGAFVGSFIGHLKGRLSDRAFMTDYFLRHTEAVKSVIPPDRLLIYEVGSGWGPLCAFLGAPVPDMPYPSVNTRSEFQGNAAAGGHESFAAPAH